MDYKEIKANVDEMSCKLLEYIFACDLTEDEKKQIIRSEAGSFIMSSLVFRPDNPSKTGDELRLIIENITGACFEALTNIYSGDLSQVKKVLAKKDKEK